MLHELEVFGTVDQYLFVAEGGDERKLLETNDLDLLETVMDRLLEADKLPKTTFSQYPVAALKIFELYLVGNGKVSLSDELCLRLKDELAVVLSCVRVTSSKGAIVEGSSLMFETDINEDVVALSTTPFIVTQVLRTPPP